MQTTVRFSESERTNDERDTVTEIARENQIIFGSNKKQAAIKQKSLRPCLRASQVISRVALVLVCDGVFSVNNSNR